MYAVYAFCRDVDDVADDQDGSIPDRRAELEGWTADIASLYAGGPPGRAAYLTQAVGRFGLAHADFQAVIDGMMMDVVQDIVAPDWATLDLYCDRVASAVGRLSTRVFGMEAEPGRELAHHLGRALQLTNILRDIDEDAAIGRLYLPLEMLEKAGVPTTSARTATADPRIDAAAREVASLARCHFTETDKVLAARPRGHLIAPRLMQATYTDILAKMTAAGWRLPRRRIRTNKPRLLATLLRLKLGL